MYGEQTILIGFTSISVACNDLARMTIMVFLVHPIVLSFTLAYCGICIELSTKPSECYNNDRQCLC